MQLLTCSFTEQSSAESNLPSSCCLGIASTWVLVINVPIVLCAVCEKEKTRYLHSLFLPPFSPQRFVTYFSISSTHTCVYTKVHACNARPSLLRFRQILST